jgi:ATP-dependent Zn protease
MDSDDSLLQHPEESQKSLFLQRIRRLCKHCWHDEATRRHLLAVLALTVLSWVGYKRRKAIPYASAKEEPLSLLLRAAREGTIERALLGPSGVIYLFGGKWKRSVLPPGLSQKHILDTLSTCSDVSVLPESLASRLATPLLAALPFVYLGFLYRMMKDMTGGNDIGTLLHSQSSTTMKDVAGMDSVVVEVAEVVSFLRDPSRFGAVGARPPRGILLHGPPGNGKTLLAQAVAGEANVDAFLACSASDFVEMYVGRGAARVRSLFQQAKRTAKQKSSNWWNKSSRTPTAILFIDELDALAKIRSYDNTNDERDHCLNALLTEMDGFAQSDVTLIVMAASNRADVLDPAILRRFDRKIHVGFPDSVGRKAILQVHARRIVCCANQVDWEYLASDNLTAGCSGADLRNLINEAALLAVRDNVSSVTQSHLEHAARRIMQMKIEAPRRMEFVLPTRHSGPSSSPFGF